MGVLVLVGFVSFTLLTFTFTKVSFLSVLGKGATCRFFVPQRMTCLLKKYCESTSFRSVVGVSFIHHL
jgi:hypothetical protein